jgi:hypothetical protein
VKRQKPRQGANQHKVSMRLEPESGPPREPLVGMTSELPNAMSNNFVGSPRLKYGALGPR